MEKLFRFSLFKHLAFYCFFLYPFSLLDASPRVLLIHGLGRSSFSMHRLQEALEKNGYNCQSLTYPRFGFSFEEAVNILQQQIILNHDEPIHFIGHSLGGLLSLQIRDQLPPAYQGLCITIGSPFKGSFYLDQDSWIYNFIIHPFYGEIASNLLSIDDILFKIQNRKNVHCLCGTDCEYPIVSSCYNLTEPHDCFVATDSALGFECEQKISYPLNHNALIKSHDVFATCIAILNSHAQS